MAYTIAIFNQKGGVGKSTTTSNLMAGLQECKKKVLSIDIDSQGHLTKFFNVDTNNQNTVTEILLNEATFEETVVHTKYGDILPCDRDLQTVISEFATKPNSILRLKKLVTQVADKYDYILFDCPPNANQVTISSLIASDYVIIPTEAEYFSLDGIAEISITLDMVKDFNPNLKVLGILIVKYNPIRTLTRQIEKNLDNIAKNYFDSKVFRSKINDTVAIPNSQVNGVSIYEYENKSKVARNFMLFVKEVIKGVEGNE